MNFSIQHNDLTGTITFNGSVTLREIVQLDLDRLELAQISEPAKAPADHLLDLEMIFRRHAEQNQTKDITQNDSENRHGE